MSYNRILSAIFMILLAFIFQACEKKQVSGCKGRANGIKSGPTSLYLPYPSGDSHEVGQTWYGGYSHYSDGGEHALDFTMNYNETITPVMAGRVIAVKDDSDITCSGPCPDANFVVIDHGDGFLGRYFHFCKGCVNVKEGDLVSSNTTIGGAGATGWSTGIHLHFELADWEEGCTTTYGFANINSGARTALTASQSYTSANAGSSSYTPSTITGDTFKGQGVTLTSTIAWYLSAGDTITIAGSITDGSSAIKVMILSITTNSVVASQDYNVSTTFSKTYTIPSLSAGTYSLAISTVNNGSYTWDNPPQIVIH